MWIVQIIAALIVGIVFGVALEKGRVFEPGAIVGQFQFRNFTMLKMFLSAIATSLIVIGIMYAFGWIELGPKAAVFPATIVGGLIFGGGMSLAGGCPGTVLAQIGAGYRDAWAVLVGAIFGAMAYGYLDPTISAWNKGLGKVTLSDMTGVPHILLAFCLAAVLIVALVALEKWRPLRNDLGENYDGVFEEDNN